MSQVRVSLYHDWRYYQAGEIISVNKEVAHALVEQGLGEYAKSKKPEEKELTVKKEIKGAPKDRMLKSAPVKK